MLTVRENLIIMWGILLYMGQFQNWCFIVIHVAECSMSTLKSITAKPIWVYSIYLNKLNYRRLPLIRSSWCHEKTSNETKSVKRHVFLAVKWNCNDVLTQKKIRHLSVGISFSVPRHYNEVLWVYTGALFLLFSWVKKCSEEKRSLCIGSTQLRFAVARHSLWRSCDSSTYHALSNVISTWSHYYHHDCQKNFANQHTTSTPLACLVKVSLGLCFESQSCK